MSESIKFNSIDFEENIYDVYTFMKYKGKPFTGTLIYENEVIEFKDGNANGRCYEHWDNGQLAFEGIYENGNCIHSKSWYRNGQLHEDFKKNGDNLIYDMEGYLLYKNYCYFYKNGNYKIKTLNVFKDTIKEYYNDIGELAVIWKRGMNNNKNTIQYFENVLKKCYIELLTPYKYELDSDYNKSCLSFYEFKPWLVSLYNKGGQEKLHAIEILEEINNLRIEKNYDFTSLYEKIKKNENDYIHLDMRAANIEVIE